MQNAKSFLMTGMLLLLVSGCRFSLYPSNPLPEFEQDNSPTLAGIDTDGNGIRDDIERYLGTLELNDSQQKALNRLAVSLQVSLETDLERSLDSQPTLQKNHQDYVSHLYCFVESMQDDEKAGSIVDSLHLYTINTPQRIDKHKQNQTVLLNQPSPSPDESVCH
ncbi:hypothetical protein [Vibrio ulleungensis]|uniref:Lipoprotein n=1 Tax=Vibrio ulleungensis TaxID=2807619 RepID=A0ABS2HC52_9VIBR|nr:hypothetical protein [Vibrio ulleungensis]MBM7035175.1 hypothetical protein [Vibrio ulleungensis]